MTRGAHTLKPHITSIVQSIRQIPIAWYICAFISLLSISLGALFVPYLSLGLILLVAIGLLSAVIFFIVALQLRKQLNTPRAGVTDKAVYRAHARRFRAWFAAHTFIWTVLAGSSTLILLFLFGFRPLIFAYATAALTCTLYGAYGLSWLRSPRELGICWESEVLNLNRDAGYWARSNTILLLWDRFAAALREDLQRVQIGRAHV